jgi:hypothetical protein
VWRGAGQLAHGAAAGGGLHLLHAGDAVQLLFEALLHTQLADVLGAAVVALRFVDQSSMVFFSAWLMRPM